MIFDDVPVFKNFNMQTHGFQVSPFVHGNLLFTPQGEEKLYYSFGFGISFQSEAISIELNYTPYVEKGKYDHGVEFSINFGID